jgi:dipeptidyl aminopeptidase/acylaminoacyl peptidase
MLRAVSSIALLLASAGIAAAQPAADDPRFLAFPIATKVVAADAPAFAWLVRRGDQSIVMMARGPAFQPVRLFAQDDVDGQPVTDVAISPDGTRVAFQTGTALIGDAGYNPAGLIDPPKATMWIIDARAGATPVKLGLGTGARFSPDGQRLTWRHGRDLWAVDTAAGAKPAVLIAGGAVYGAGVWSRDGKRLIFAQNRGGYSHLGMLPVGGDRITWLVTGADRLTDPVLSPDGRSVAYLRWPGREHTVSYDLTENEAFAVETVDLDSGTVRTLWQTRDRAGNRSSDDPEGHLRWADDRTIVFRSEADGWARLYAVPRGGGQARALTPAECEVAESELTAPDQLFVIHNCRGIDTRQASTITVSSGAERPVASSDVVLANAAASGSGRFVAITGATPDAPPLVRILDLDAQRVARAEIPADYGYERRYAAPAPQVVRLEAADGGTVPAQLFLPATKGPHPALVYVHGGPPRQMFPAFHFGQYYATDYAINRRLAELGYVVVAINYRSGVGYGRAFREAPGRAWRGASEYSDVLGAGRWLAARGDVDAKRIGIWGGSYGGLLTGQALARNSKLFAAGVAVHGVFDWSWPSPTPGHLNPSRTFGVPDDRRSAAFAASPLGEIKGWTSPVLLFSGDQDMNVDVLETVDLTQKLRARDVDVRTVIVPGEAHDFVRHATYVQMWSEMQRFFDAKLRQP